ncbi:hypothetical protein ACFGVS_00595 [Mucilaginibacter sp. AW1-7]|uniref:hypothetical protein n=1 Tax=Mucilaginibacter sp. AW1-7 TaxID=3349874 RepID=UPI003F73F1F5
MGFSARGDNHKYRELHAEMFYASNSIYLDIDYTDMEYVMSTVQKSNTILGSNDLLGGAFEIARMDCDTGYSISVVSLNNKLGLQHGYLFNMDDNASADCAILRGKLLGL